MSPRYKRLFAWVSLVAILVVHLRLDAFALRLSAATTEDQPRGCCAACCRAETSQPASESTPQNNGTAPDEHGDGPLPSHGCPCCPQQDCSHCCVFCIYAKAPCGPTTSTVNALPADEIVAVVADPSAHAPVAPIDEFFQPPRV